MLRCSLYTVLRSQRNGSYPASDAEKSFVINLHKVRYCSSSGSLQYILAVEIDRMSD